MNIIEQIESIIARCYIGVITTMNGTDHHLINQLTRIKEALEQNSHKHSVSGNTVLYAVEPTPKLSTDSNALDSGKESRGMQREIKFRVWDGTQWSHFKIGQPFGDWASSVYDDHCLNGRRFFQNTGLFDKHGKEIWEGDIIKIDECECVGHDANEKEIWESCVGEVSFEYGMFVFDGHSAGTLPLYAYKDKGNIYDINDALMFGEPTGEVQGISGTAYMPEAASGSGEGSDLSEGAAVEKHVRGGCIDRTRKKDGPCCYPVGTCDDCQVP